MISSNKCTQEHSHTTGPTMASKSTTAASNIPQFVEPDMDNGCETGACELAKLFYNTNEHIIRRLRWRRELSDFYIATFNSWAPSTVIENPALHRTFSQVLYALVNDGKVLRINNSRLLWANNRMSHHPRHNHPRHHHPRHHRPRHHHPRHHRPQSHPSHDSHCPADPDRQLPAHVKAMY